MKFHPNRRPIQPRFPPLKSVIKRGLPSDGINDLLGSFRKMPLLNQNASPFYDADMHMTRAIIGVTLAAAVLSLLQICSPFDEIDRIHHRLAESLAPLESPPKTSLMPNETLGPAIANSVAGYATLDQTNDLRSQVCPFEQSPDFDVVTWRQSQKRSQQPIQAMRSTTSLVLGGIKRMVSVLTHGTDERLMDLANAAGSWPLYDNVTRNFTCTHETQYFTS